MSMWSLSWAQSKILSRNLHAAQYFCVFSKLNWEYSEKAWNRDYTDGTVGFRKSWDSAHFTPKVGVLRPVPIATTISKLLQTWDFNRTSIASLHMWLLDFSASFLLSEMIPMLTQDFCSEILIQIAMELEANTNLRKIPQILTISEETRYSSTHAQHDRQQSSNVDSLTDFSGTLL